MVQKPFEHKLWLSSNISRSIDSIILMGTWHEWFPCSIAAYRRKNSASENSRTGFRERIERPVLPPCWETRQSTQRCADVTGTFVLVEHESIFDYYHKRNPHGTGTVLSHIFCSKSQRPGPVRDKNVLSQVVDHLPLYFICYKLEWDCPGTVLS